MEKEKLVAILRRAEAKKKEISCNMSQLENQMSLLDQILHAVDIESYGQLEALLTQYKQMYSKKLPYAPSE